MGSVSLVLAVHSPVFAFVFCFKHCKLISFSRMLNHILDIYLLWGYWCF